MDINLDAEILSDPRSELFLVDFVGQTLDEDVLLTDFTCLVINEWNLTVLVFEGLSNCFLKDNVDVLIVVVRDVGVETVNADPVVLLVLIEVDVVIEVALD